MRSLKLVTFAVPGMTSVASLAQARSMPHTPDTRAGSDTSVPSSRPRSTRASNIVPENTRSAIAPALPPSPAGDKAGPRDYLKAARETLIAGRAGQARESLEMTETRELTREVPPEAASVPDRNPRVNRIRDAVHALGEGNRGRAIEIIDAMAN